MRDVLVNAQGLVEGEERQQWCEDREWTAGIGQARQRGPGGGRGRKEGDDADEAKHSAVALRVDDVQSEVEEAIVDKLSSRLRKNKRARAENAGGDHPPLGFGRGNLVRSLRGHDPVSQEGEHVRALGSPRRSFGTALYAPWPTTLNALCGKDPQVNELIEVVAGLSRGSRSRRASPVWSDPRPRLRSPPRSSPSRRRGSTRRNHPVGACTSRPSPPGSGCRNRR